MVNSKADRASNEEMGPTPLALYDRNQEEGIASGGLPSKVDCWRLKIQAVYITGLIFKNYLMEPTKRPVTGASTFS